MCRILYKTSISPRQLTRRGEYRTARDRTLGPRSTVGTLLRGLRVYVCRVWQVDALGTVRFSLPIPSTSTPYADEIANPDTAHSLWCGARASQPRDTV